MSPLSRRMSHCKPSLFLLGVALLATSTCAVICDGDASNNCNGMRDTCTDLGLCVVDETSDQCCPLPTSASAAAGNFYNGTCVSGMDTSVCDGGMGLASITEDTPEPTSMPTVKPTSPPTTSPTKPPTLSPSYYPTSSSPPSVTCYRIEVGLIFDDFPGELSWEVAKGRRPSRNNSKIEVFEESQYYSPEDGYKQASDRHLVCLPEGKYTFTMYDSDGDGMCCKHGEGRYVVLYQPTGELIATGGEFEHEESTTFNIPFEAPTLRDTDGDGLEDRTKNVIPPVPANFDGKCKNEFGLHLETDDYGVENTWELRERSQTQNYEDGNIIASGGPYMSEHTYDISYCIPPGKYTFIFYDWQCDGLIGETVNGTYKILINGFDVFTGGRHDKYEEITKLEFTTPVTSQEQPPQNVEELSSGWRHNIPSSWYACIWIVASFALWN